jgi:hypothetical protein
VPADDTTRRWKFFVDGRDARLNTKIEFSAREADPERAFETARGDLGRAMGLRVVKPEHYLPPAAIRPNIHALAQRSETEPRDVFDLDLLFASYRDRVQPGEVDPVTLEAAIDAALNIPYEMWVSTKVPRDRHEKCRGDQRQPTRRAIRLFEPPSLRSHDHLVVEARHGPA